MTIFTDEDDQAWTSELAAGLGMDPTKWKVSRFKRARLPTGELMLSTSRSGLTRVSFWSLVQFDGDVKLWAARVSHFVLVKGESTGEERVAICDLFEVTERSEASGSYVGQYYEAKCAAGAFEPVMHSVDAQYPVLLSSLQRKFVWFYGALVGQVGRRWLFIPYSSNRPYEGTDLSR